MSFQITGKLIAKSDTEKVTDSFSKREFVIEVEDGKYPQFVKFQCVQDRTGIVDGLKKGQDITVHFDLRGREWQGKYFTNLNAWRVEAGAADGLETASQPAPAPPTESSNPADDLPF